VLLTHIELLCSHKEESGNIPDGVEKSSQNGKAKGSVTGCLALGNINGGEKDRLTGTTSICALLFSHPAINKMVRRILKQELKVVICKSSIDIFVT
jgi:hypothetical protein